MRVLVCGSRTFEDESAVHAVLSGLRDGGARSITVIEGGSAGADALAAEWAEFWDTPGFEGSAEHESYPANWGKYGKGAGPIRNQQMLDEGKPDVVWAFVDKPLAESRGTADMVHRAARSGVPTYVVQRIAAGIEDEAVS